MAYYVGHEDKIVYFFKKYNEYLIPVHDGGSSGILIWYCPWCGKRLPESKRAGSDEAGVKKNEKAK
ncbi:MAG: hypothetical protein ACE144_21275 [Thermodesulfobacteriota bacterium]